MTTTTTAHVATLLAAYSPDLANAWRTQPFNREDLAKGFASGFGSTALPSAAKLALTTARLERLQREEVAYQETLEARKGADYQAQVLAEMQEMGMV